MIVENSLNEEIKSVMNVNVYKFRGFAEETCNMYHNSTEVDHSTKETLTRPATTFIILELMQ